MEQFRNIFGFWEALLKADSGLSESFYGTIQFDITGDGGGTWRLQCSPEVRVYENAGDADCTIQIAIEDFLSLISGNMNPQFAWRSGTLKVRGNTNLALHTYVLFEEIARKNSLASSPS